MTWTVFGHRRWRAVTGLLLLVAGLGFGSARQTGDPVATDKRPGFLGSYHPFRGTAYAATGVAEGTLLQEAFAFGTNAIISQASYNGYTFAENVTNNCDVWGVNLLFGMLRPPTEKGVVNQPGDRALLEPYAREPGMIQGAARFSRLAARCPQLAGVIIDDFYNDYPKLVTAADLRDIRAALTGKPVDGRGRVDHGAPAATPHLKLYIVVYEHQLGRADDKVRALVDGVSFWIWKQNDRFGSLDEYVDALGAEYPGKSIVQGAYVFNSQSAMRHDSVSHMVQHAVALYDAGRIDGLLLFSAIWLSREHISRARWDKLALPATLRRYYYPHLGDATGRVIDAATRRPIEGALIVVTRVTPNGRQLAARKHSGADGRYRFGGWAKGGTEARYEVTVSHPSYQSRALDLALRPAGTLRVDDTSLEHKSRRQ